MPETDRPIFEMRLPLNSDLFGDNLAENVLQKPEPEPDNIEFICYECAEEFDTPCDYIINGETYCGECESDLSRCVDCNEYVFDSFIDNDNGDRYCRKCYYERYTRCENCDCEILQDESLYNEDDGCTYCQDCYPRTHSCLHDYEYRPSPIYYRGRNESQNSRTISHNLYFGIELEIESGGNDIEYAVDNLPDLVYAKADGSLSSEGGFEVVSHPTTYQWLCENADQWLKILALRKDGFRSYNTDTCGMHVHLSKNYFGTLHLYKFLKFFYENPEFILMISQRDEHSFNEWATLKTTKQFNSDDESICYKARYKSGNYERHCAVNLQNNHTIEVRIFRGTLNPRSFWKNIEFLQALVEFTAKKSIDDISVMAFRCFLFENKKRFVNLYNWLFVKKFAKGATIE